MKIWTVCIAHKYGQDITVHASADAAEEKVAQFARDWWTDFQDKIGMTDAAYEAAHGRKAMIEAYFNAENEHRGDESADIEEHELEGVA